MMACPGSDEAAIEAAGITPLQPELDRIAALNDTAAIAGYLRQEIEAGAALGRVVHLSDFLHVPWYKRAAYGAAFLLYRTVIHIITLGKDA